MNNTVAISRGWTVLTADGKRVGDVTEVHGHYLLVSRGVILVRDMFLPLGAVDRVEGATVILSVTQEVLRTMNLAHVPPPPPELEAPPLQDPAPSYETPAYASDTDAPAEPYSYPTWEPEETPEYEEMPSYTRAQPNGLVEVEVGLNLAFQDLGYGETIVLMPGWPFDSAIWEPLPTILARDYRVITYDPRGTGASDRPWEYYGTELQTTDLHRLIVEQSLRDVTLVGWSSAALVALMYAREHHKRVARVVLLGPLVPAWLAADDAEEMLGVRPELDAATQEAWQQDLLDDRPALHERLIDRLTHRPLSGAQRQWLWQRLMLGAPHAQLKAWEALRSYDPAELLAEIQTPVTIISGESDRLAPPALAARLASLLPRAQSLTLSECGHAVFLDQREAVVQALRDLLTPSEEALPTSEEEDQPYREEEPEATIESADTDVEAMDRTGSENSEPV